MAPDAQKVEAVTAVTDVVIEVARKNSAEDVAVWGAFRPVEEQKVVQRELIAFEASLVLKAGNRNGYNLRRHLTDFNDSWLCAYPAAGYTLVTEDGRLKKALMMAGCREPRVLQLEEGLAVAEEWLAGMTAVVEVDNERDHRQSG